MKDIGGLEQRIENIEFYTQLSLLETETSNLQIVDANGLNRFKSGFFVDNFKSHDSHHIAHVDFSASIDRKEGILRPGPYTTASDLLPGSSSVVGIGTSSNPDVDLNFVDDIDGLNIKKTGSLITLDYTEREFFKQPYASRVENCTPFLVTFYEGDLELTPNSDTWVATRRVNAQTVNQTAAFDAATAILGVNAQTGLSEVDWGAWETTWTGEELFEELIDNNQRCVADQRNRSNTQNEVEHVRDRSGLLVVVESLVFRTQDKPCN